MRDDYLLVTRLASPRAASTAAHDAQSAPGAAPLAPGAPSSCVWFWGCEEPAIRAGLCAKHADICRDEIAEYEDYAVDHGAGW